MNESANTMEMLAGQEQALVFDSFSTADAVAIGLKLYENAKVAGNNIAIQISLNRKMVFHLSMDGCSTDNDAWLNRKENMVYRFAQSSWRTVAFCEMMQTNVFDFYCLDRDNFAGAAGGFPILVKGVGCVGAISCGGMMPPEDHANIVNVLQEYLKK